MTALSTGKYSSSEYDGFRAAPEILQAIETAIASSVLDRDRLTAFGAWEYPSDFEKVAIVDSAFELAEPETDRLAWGCDFVLRPGATAS